MAAEQKFKVVITGDASGLTAAAAQGKAALQGLGSTAKANAEVAEALKRIGNDAKQMAVETSAAAVQGQRFGGQLGEMKKIAGQLSQEFPVAGLALRAFLNPIGAVASVGVAGFIAAKQAISDYLALFEELPNVTTSWIKKLEDWRRATQDGAKAWNDYQKAFNDALNPKATTASAADKEVETIKARAAQQTAALDRGSRLADAQDDAAVAAGRMSPQQAALRKAQRAVSYGAARDQVSADAVRAEQGVRVREEERLKNELPLKRAEAEARAAEASMAREAKREADYGYDRASRRAMASEDAADEAKRAADEYGGVGWQDYIPGYGLWRSFRRNQANRQAELLASGAFQAKDELVQRGRIADDAEFAAYVAGQSATAAQSDSVGTAGALTAVRAELPAIQARAQEMGKDQAADAIIRLLQSQSAFNAQMKAAAEEAQRRIDQLAAQSRQ